jgi:hypothetical protein
MISFPFRLTRCLFDVGYLKKNCLPLSTTKKKKKKKKKKKEMVLFFVNKVFFEGLDAYIE